MDSRGLDSLLRGAAGGALVALVAGVEMVTWNRRTLNPESIVALLALWALGGAGLGVPSGWLGARAFRIIRWSPADGAIFFGMLVSGHVLLGPGVSPLMALAVLSGRWLRRRFVPTVPKLDHSFPPLVVAVAIFVQTITLPPAPPAFAPSDELGEDSPLPGSVPVAITVHAKAGFPDVPAIHLTLRRLRASDEGRRATLWTGRIPDRTRTGRGRPRRLPGGGVSWIPERWGARALARALPIARADEAPFLPAGSLADLAQAARIPVLRTPPAPGDPGLHLRILESEEPPSPEVAEALRRQGVWIDVTLGAGDRDEVTISGVSVAMRPATARITLADVTPTALHVLGLAVPRGCDGRVLVELFAKDEPATRPPRYRSLASVSPNDDSIPEEPASDATTSR